MNAFFSTLLPLLLTVLTGTPEHTSQPASKTRATCSVPGAAVCTVAHWDSRKNEGKITIAGTLPDSFTLRVSPKSASPYSIPVAFTSTDSVRDCTATLECPNGSLLECAASGTNTSCSNNSTSVGCFVLDEDGNSVSGTSSTCS